MTLQEGLTKDGGGRRAGAPLTRRQLCAAGAGLVGAAALGLAGCGTIEDEELESFTGYAADTVVRTYPVTARIYVDSDVSNVMRTSYDGDHPALEWYAEWYRGIDEYRGQVTFDFVWTEPAELLELAQEGFPDGDGIIALEHTIEVGLDSGALYSSGIGGYRYRNLDHLASTVVMVRAAGSGVEMPPAASADGEEVAESMTKMQQLGSFDGRVALADPAVATEGWRALYALQKAGLFAFDAGSRTEGTLDPSIEDKVEIYPDQDAAMAAVASGECQAGFAFSDSLGERYPAVEAFYDLPGRNGKVSYYGTAIAGGEQDGVALDFFHAVMKKAT